MSHFICLVVLPEGTVMEDVAPAASELLEPFSQSRPVTAYETKCFCVGMEAHKEVRAQVDQQHSIEELRKAFKKLPKEERTRDRWREMIAPVRKLEEELLANHQLKDSPSPTCSVCEGVGSHMTESNPEGRWDWCVIGGRWDGWIFGPEREKASRDDKGGFNFADEHHTPENNTRLVHDIPIDEIHYCPFAVITPDGQWHHEGRMGWWGIVTDEVDPSEWHEEVKRLLAQYPNHLAVAVDCHV